MCACVCVCTLWNDSNRIIHALRVLRSSNDTTDFTQKRENALFVQNSSQVESISRVRLKTLDYPRNDKRFGSNHNNGTSKTWKLTLESLIVVNLSRRASHVLALQHRQKTLVYANVLLLGLDHPHPLLPHRPHYTKYVHVLGHQDLLQYSVQRDERAATPDPRAAMDHDRPLIRPHPLPKRSNESGQRLGRIWNAEVRPRREMEVLDHPFHVSLSNGTEDFLKGD